MCTALHTEHASRSTIFFVVFAFLWNTGLVWPPYPDCLRSYRRFPARTHPLPLDLQFPYARTDFLRTPRLPQSLLTQHQQRSVP